MSIDPKFVELTAGVLEIYILNTLEIKKQQHRQTRWGKLLYIAEKQKRVRSRDFVSRGIAGHINHHDTRTWIIYRQKLCPVSPPPHTPEMTRGNAGLTEEREPCRPQAEICNTKTIDFVWNNTHTPLSGNVRTVSVSKQYQHSIIFPSRVGRKKNTFSIWMYIINISLTTHAKTSFWRRYVECASYLIGGRMTCFSNNMQSTRYV